MNKGWDLITDWNSGYYNDIIKLLCMLAISGNWWKPGEPISEIIHIGSSGSKGIAAVSAHYNPGNEEIAVSFILNQPAGMTLSCLDTRGRVVARKSVGFMQRGKCKTVLPLASESLSNGMYFLQVSVGNTKVITKINILL